MPAAIFSAQNLRFYVIKGYGDVDIGVVFFKIGVGFKVGPKRGWTSGIHGYFADVNGNLGRGRGFLKKILDLLRAAQAHLLGSVHDQLRRENRLLAKSTFVGTLAVGQRSGGVGIFPAILVPIGYVLTEDN